MTTTMNGTATECVAACSYKSPNISAGLLMAQQLIKEIPKGSRNEYHQYDYTSADTRIKCAREALHAAGMTFALVKHDTYARKDISAVFDHDDESAFIFVKSHFRLEHENGEVREYSFELPAIPGGGRPLDKAILGCMTTSTGYILRDLLQMPSEGEDENDVSGRDDRSVQAPRRQPTQNWEQKRAEQQMNAPAPTLPAGTTKGRLWGAITKWSNPQPGNPDALPKAGKRIYEFLKIPTDGSAPEKEIARASIWVQDQIRKGVNFGEWAAERDEKTEAEKVFAGIRAKVESTTPPPTRSKKKTAPSDQTPWSGDGAGSINHPRGEWLAQAPGVSLRLP